MASNQEPLDVLVVGAGPTGLTLAAQLHALGATARIVERQMDRVHESRALGVQPRTLEVLGGIGIARTLIERGNDAVRLHLHAGGRVFTLQLFDIGIDDTPYPFLLFISQAETEAVLNGYLTEHGVPVERGVELLAFSPGPENVACTLAHGDGSTEEVRARYLVGCDGAHSTVRRGAGIPFEGGAYPHTFALGDVEVDGDLERDAVHSFMGAGGMLFFFPLGKPATWRMMGMAPAAERAAEIERETTDLTLEGLQAICDAFTGGALRLRDPAWMTYFRLHHRHAPRYREGRVFLAGDAAHVHSPAGAQGMNTGIQDAWNLGWKLALVAAGIADDSLLDTYDDERRPVGHFVLRFTDRAFSAATSTATLSRLLRTSAVPWAVPLVLRSRRARAFAFRTVSELAVRYRRSPAAQEGAVPLQGGPKPGDRLPDAPIVREGRPTSLHEVLAAPRFHLLLCGAVDDAQLDRLASLERRYEGVLDVHRLTRDGISGSLHDGEGTALGRLGVESTALYHVRPDGYIGFRSGGTDVDELEAYLARWLPGR